MTTSIPRINIEVTADDPNDSELVARLVTASLNTHGFEDVTNVSAPTHTDKEEEVVEAMRNLSPSIFTAEVTVESSTFDESDGIGGTDDVPGEEFPEQEGGDDDEIVPRGGDDD